MTELVWTDEYDRTVQAFRGQQPRSPEVEKQCLEHWQLNPLAFRVLVDEVADAITKGKVRWGWTILLDRLEKHDRARHEVAKTDDDRGRHIRNSEGFLHVAGCYLTTADEADTELFGADPIPSAPLDYLEQLEQTTRESPGRAYFEELLLTAIEESHDTGVQPMIEPIGGYLHEYADDAALRRRMRDTWEALRPQGEAAEQRAREYQERPWTHWTLGKRVRNVYERRRARLAREATARGEDPPQP